MSRGFSLSLCALFFPDRNQKKKLRTSKSGDSEILSRKPGNHPNFKKKLSEGKGHSRSSSRNSGHSRSNSRNGSHDLIYVKTLFSEQLSERLSELVGRQNFSPNSRSFFFKIGVVPAHQNFYCGASPAQITEMESVKNSSLKDMR